MTLNGDDIGFSAIDNPYWNTMTVKTNLYSANRILQDSAVFDIDRSLVSAVTKEFCEAAGVPIWEEY